MIYGKGMYLRRMVKEDIDAVYQLCVNDQVLKYDGGKEAYSYKEHLKENYKYLEMRSMKKYVIVNSTGTMVGIISYRKSEYVNDIYNIGILIGKEYWRHGYGYKSINTLLGYLFKRKKAHKIELEVVEDNTAAIKCYKKCGFIEEGKRRKKYFHNGKYLDTVLMGILEEEYRERN